MAIFAGETVRVFAEGSDWDDTPLGPAQVDEVTVTICDGAGEVVELGSMEWVPEESRWRYDWDSIDPGPYSIEVAFDTPNGVSMDVRRLTLEAPRTVRPLLRPLAIVRV